MRITEAGLVAEGIWYLGREESGFYLLEGSSSSMIISGGMSWIVSEVLEQMEQFGIDEQRIDKLLVLHAHFDHLGLVPFFARRLPRLKVYASRAAWRTIGNPKAIETMNRFSRSTAERHGRADILESFDLAWRDDVTGKTVGEGDRLDCGNREVQIIEIPGHSSCSIAAYDPAAKALFPSDGGGIPFKDSIIPSGNSDYTLFQRSLEKLSRLPVDYFCADHGGYVTGEEAGNFIQDTMTAAAEFRLLMERVYRRNGSVDATARRLVSLAQAARPDYFLAREILEGIYRQMVQHIASAMEEAS